MPAAWESAPLVTGSAPAWQSAPLVNEPERAAAPVLDDYGRPVDSNNPPDTTAAREAIGRVGAAAADAWRNTPPVFTPKMQAVMDQGPLGQMLWNPMAKVAGGVMGGVNALGAGLSAAVGETATAAGQPALGRDLNILGQVVPIAMGGAPGMPLTKAGLAEREAGVPVAHEPQFTTAPELPRQPAPAFIPPDANLPPPRLIPPPQEPVRPAFIPPEQAMAQPEASARPGAVGADVTTAPIPPPTPAEKATALQKMVNQSAEDRLTPQGRDDAVYFPGVVRPEAMKDFSNAPEGQMSSALQHKALYNTDSNYHDQFDAQVKNNNAIMLDGTTLPDGTRVDGLHDMFGDANAREAAMNDARALMPGSVHLFDNEKPVDIQPVADTINKILASSKGKIDGVANVLRKILPKLYDKDGTPETMPSMIKGIFDDVNNKLYDKSPTIEGNEARQASDQLKQVKASLSEVIGGGLPGSKWTDYLTNLSGALGQVDKLDYMQQFLTGTKKLTNGSGDLQFNKVSKMLEDIQKHSTDQTGGARLMTMDEINKIEAVRNELAAKDLLDKRAAVRGSPTTQIANASGVLGSGPLGSAVRAAAEGGAHILLAAKTAGVGNLVLAGVKAGRKASEAQKATNALMATKGRLLDTTPRNPLGPE